MRNAIVVFVLLALANLAHAVPSRFAVQGVLRDGAGALQTMPVDVSISLFDAATAGTKLAGPFTTTAAPVIDGLFTMQVSDATLATALGSAAEVWLEVTVGTDVFARQLVNPQIFSLMCGVADRAKTLDNLTVLPNGNVGIGTTNPQSQLEIASATGALAQLSTFSSTALGESVLALDKSRGTSGTPAAVQNGDELSRIYGRAYSGTAIRNATAIVSSVDGTPAAAAVPAALSFWTSSPSALVERMRILANGRVGIGTNAPTGTLHVFGSGFNGGSITAQSSDNATSIGIVGKDGAGVNDAAILAFSDSVNQAIVSLSGQQSGVSGDLRVLMGASPAERMRITKAGNVGIGTSAPAYKLDVTGDINASAVVRAGGVALSSDARLKDNVTPIAHALADLEKLRGVRFTWKDGGKKSIGVIAQEVEKVYPELVSTHPTTGMKAVDYPSLVGALIEGEKELAAENRTLRERLDRLEARMAQAQPQAQAPQRRAAR